MQFKGQPPPKKWCRPSQEYPKPNGIYRLIITCTRCRSDYVYDESIDEYYCSCEFENINKESFHEEIVNLHFQYLKTKIK